MVLAAPLLTKPAGENFSLACGGQRETLYVTDISRKDSNELHRLSGSEPGYHFTPNSTSAAPLIVTHNEKAKGDEVRTDVYRRAALAVKAYKLSITSGKAARDSSFEQKIVDAGPLWFRETFAEKGEDYWRRQLEDAEEDNVRGFKRSHPIEGERYQHE